MLNFEMEVMNILETKTYEHTDEQMVTMIKNWLGQEDLQLMKMFTSEKKEKWKNDKRTY